MPGTSHMAIIITVIASILGGAGSFLLKKGAGLAWNFRNYKALSGALLMVVSGIIYLIALREGELSVLYPVSGLAYVWSLLLGWRFLGEKMSNYKVIGIIMIMAGLFLIVR